VVFESGVLESEPQTEPIPVRQLSGGSHDDHGTQPVPGEARRARLRRIIVALGLIATLALTGNAVAARTACVTRTAPVIGIATNSAKATSYWVANA
jgi:hypothetical protein